MTMRLQYLRILFSSQVVLMKIFKGMVNRNQIFAFFYIQSSAKMPVSKVSP